MARKERTLEEYKKVVSDTMKSYQMDKINFSLDFNVREENHGQYYHTMFVNRMTATKILFDAEMKLIITKEIFVGEAKKIVEMLGEIDG